MSTKKAISFSVRYGTGKEEKINANDLLSAQKEAHKRAAKQKTIVIFVKPYNL